MKKIIRLTESDLVKLVNRVMNEQLIKRYPDKMNAETNKFWNQIKSALTPMGFKPFGGKLDNYSGINPIVGDREKIETLKFSEGSYDLKLKWPGGSVDSGQVDPKIVSIELYSDDNSPENNKKFKMLSNKLVQLSRKGPGLNQQITPVSSRDDYNMTSFDVNFQPQNIINVVRQFVPLLK